MHGCWARERVRDDCGGRWAWRLRLICWSIWRMADERHRGRSEIDNKEARRGSSRNGGDCAHEVSILMAIIGAARPVARRWPRSKVSMTIMRPPQHGQGVRSLSSSLASVSLAWFCAAALSSCARARDVLGAGAIGEQAVMADAVEALWAGRGSGSGG